jgi:hypothetical protein
VRQLPRQQDPRPQPGRRDPARQPEADAWLRRARFDGRTEGVAPKDDTFEQLGWHCYMSADVAAALLLKLHSLPQAQRAAAERRLPRPFRIAGQVSDPPRRLGDGNVPIAIGVIRGRVHMELPPGHDWAVMDPENCRQIAEGLARAGYEARYGVKPSEGSSALGDDLRLRCINRVAQVAGSLSREGKNNQQIAAAVVDVLLPMLT